MENSNWTYWEKVCEGSSYGEGLMTTSGFIHIKLEMWASFSWTAGDNTTWTECCQDNEDHKPKVRVTAQEPFEGKKKKWRNKQKKKGAQIVRS